MDADSFWCDLTDAVFLRIKQERGIDYNSPLTDEIWQQAKKEVALKIAQGGKEAEEICLARKKKKNAYEEALHQANEKREKHQIKMAEQRDAVAQRIAAGDTKSKRRRERRRK